MPWWLDAPLLAAALLLWSLGRGQGDDVIALLEKLLAAVAVLVVLLGGRQLPLELLALALACWLPSAARINRQQRRRTSLGNSSLISPSGPSAG